MGGQENVQVTKKMYADFKGGDIDGILNALAEDVDWGCDTVASDVPWLGIRRGRAAVREFFDVIAKETDIPVFEQDDFLASDDRVVVTWHAELTLKKNGQTIVYPEAVHIWTFGQDGKITRFREHSDTAAIVAAWRS